MEANDRSGGRSGWVECGGRAEGFNIAEAGAVKVEQLQIKKGVRITVTLVIK